MKQYIFLAFMLIPFISVSQTITGKVFGNDSNGKQPLPGVNIIWENTHIGVTSNGNGEFQINKNSNQHVLVFSFVGYSSQAVRIDNTGPYEIILEPNFIEMAGVVVTPRNRGSYISPINPIHTTRIGGLELHKAACCNLSESFETNPSVDVSYSDAVTGAKQIRLLGLDGVYSQLQTENMPNLRGLATNFGLTYIPGPWMESISVSKGAASVVNGYESIAGQINVNFKKPDSPEKLFLNAFTSSHGMNEFNANSNIRVYKDEVNTGLFVHVSDLSKRNDHNNDGFLDEPLSRRINLLNYWKYNNYKGLMVQAGVNYLYEDRLGGQVNFRKGMTRKNDNPYGIGIETNRIEGFFKGGFSSANQRTSLALLTNFAFHETNSFYGLNNYIADENRFYANLVLTRDLDECGINSINTGASFVYDKFNENLYALPFSRTEQVPGLFAEYTLKPSDRFTLLTGIRADFHNIFGTFFTPRMHLRYQLSDHYTFRINAGKGYRTANVISENVFLLANSRPIIWNDDVFQEKAWNFGASFIQNYHVFERDLVINAEYFHTVFQTQLVVDRETSADAIILSPLAGQSYAGSLQFDVKYQPLERFDILLAYRFNDVKQTIGGELKEKPLVSRYKGLINLNYYTNLKKWMFDYTVQFNGGGRIPQILNDTATTFKPYTVMNVQITKYFRFGSIYAGVENICDFKQKHPVTGAENPFGSNFDATNIWGPVLGRKIYFGLRYNLNYN